jgi:hypothetical protein
MMKLIRIPKTPRSAYDPKRKVSSLLKAQIANLEAVTYKRQGVTRASRPKTEGQASAYIADLTRQLHPEVPGAAPALPLAPYGAVTSGRKKEEVRRKKAEGKRKKAKAKGKKRRAKRSLGAKK